VAFLDWLLYYQRVYKETSYASMVMKMCVTVMTVLLVITVSYYHVLRMRLFLLVNGTEDWILAVRPAKLIAVAAELTLYAIHPLPFVYYVKVTWHLAFELLRIQC
jgi:uncharacterized membrane protein YfbV (UPF0208 family)